MTQDRGSTRLTELERIIPLQEKLALGKLQGDQLFAQLDQLAIKLENMTDVLSAKPWILPGIVLSLMS